MSHRDDPFANWIGGQFPRDAEPGNDAFFGPDVLRGLVDGIGDFAGAKQERWMRRRSSPAMLACSPWLSDRPLVQALRGLSAVCVVVNKRPHEASGARGWDWLRAIHKYVPGFPVQALSELGDMALKVDGKPREVGPYDRLDDLVLPPVRTLGYRSVDGRAVPMAHAKLALLGHLWWGEQDALGNPDEFLVFTERRLWVSSANFTAHSRKSLEFGFWTEDEALVGGARTFLAQLLGASEDLDAENDAPNPELASIEFDHAAMSEAMADGAWDEDEEP